MRTSMHDTDLPRKGSVTLGIGQSDSHDDSNDEKPTPCRGCRRCARQSGVCAHCTESIPFALTLHALVAGSSS